MQRMEESKQEYYKSVALDKPFDYTTDESINTDYEKMGYASGKSDLQGQMEKQVKLSALASLIEKQNYKKT
jgi:carboxyl-terminal processing protease